MRRKGGRFAKKPKKRNKKTKKFKKGGKSGEKTSFKSLCFQRKNVILVKYNNGRATCVRRRRVRLRAKKRAFLKEEVDLWKDFN